MQIINISEAKASLSKLIEKVMNPRELGVGHWKGQIWMAGDFDDLPEDILRLFTGEAEDNAMEACC